jgi:hypothetical protein
MNVHIGIERNTTLQYRFADAICGGGDDTTIGTAPRVPHA